MHDYCRDFVHNFFGRVRHLSRARWRKIDAFRGPGNGTSALFRDVDFARPARLHDITLGDFNAHSSVSPPLGSASADRAVDDSNLALCFNNRCAGLSDAL